MYGCIYISSVYIYIYIYRLLATQIGSGLRQGQTFQESFCCISNSRVVNKLVQLTAKY